MNTKEFIKTLQDKNYCVEVADDNDICVRSSDGYALAIIDGEHTGVFTVGIHVSRIEDENERKWLVNMVTCLAKTPIDMRTGSKRFYMKHKWLERGESTYLCYSKGLDKYYLIKDTPFIKDEPIFFTSDQIKEIKKRFNTDLSDFEIHELLA